MINLIYCVHSHIFLFDLSSRSFLVEDSGKSLSFIPNGYTGKMLANIEVLTIQQCMGNDVPMYYSNGDFCDQKVSCRR